MRNSLFSETAIANIKNVRKVFLWTAVCILIGEIVIGAILIIAQSFNPTISRLMGTLVLCAVVLFVGVNNFSRMEKGSRIVQGFALTSLLTNIVWLILSILIIWEIVAFFEVYGSKMTVMAKIMIMAMNTAVASFFISNVWSITETVKPVRPLKITAIICELYCGIFSIVVTACDLNGYMDSRWYALAGLAGFAFLVMACAAVIVSRSGAKKNEEAVGVNGGIEKNAEIEAKIQEIVEKEVQARMAAAQTEEKKEVYENQPGTISKKTDEYVAENGSSIHGSSGSNDNNHNN